ncbi:MAG: hypothetical protein QG602_1522 [Verrucomicrobiota bacterium]|nr:hypothetical protein [Verrucomicrobiota bacterium]
MISMKSPALPRLLAALLAFAVLALTAFTTPDAWLKEIDTLTANDAAHPPAKGGVVFVGSSSIRLWLTLAEDFPDIATINRGFGGSELADSLFYLDRLVLAYQPRLVVLYAGENDINGGKTPEAVLADFKAFRSKLHAALPKTRLIYLSIKESPSRARKASLFQATNELIAADCASDPRCTFVDVNTAMLDASGGTRPELFVDDQLHLNAAGYAIWKRELAPHLQP